MKRGKLERWVRFLVRRAWLVLFAVALVTAGFVLGTRRLRVEFDIEASLPAGHPFVQIDHQIRRVFGGRNTMIVAIVPRDGDVWRREVLEVVQQVTMAALRLPDVIAQNVVSLAAPSVRHVEATADAITADYLMRDVPQSAEETARLRARVALHFTPHCLRHTFASIHLAHGTADVYWLARQLGHKDLRMTTAIYGHWLRPRRPEALERFDDVLSIAMHAEVVAA